MKKSQYLNKLKLELIKGGVKRAEIERVLSYYGELIDDKAYESSEDIAISSLPTPKEASREIISTLEDNVEASEENKKQESVLKSGKNSKTNNGSVAVKIVVLIFALIFILPILISVFAVIFSIFIAYFAVTVSLTVSGIFIPIMGVILTIMGDSIMVLFAYLCGGLLCLSIGLLLLSIFNPILRLVNKCVKTIYKLFALIFRG